NSLLFLYFLCFTASLHPPDLHSFPTRRSSDLRLHERRAACYACNLPAIRWDRRRPLPPGRFPSRFGRGIRGADGPSRRNRLATRSEEHTSELQSRFDLVCRLLLEKKK